MLVSVRYDVFGRLPFAATNAPAPTSERQELRKLLPYLRPGDVLACPKCAGSRRVLTAIHDPAAIARVLGALGLTAAGAGQAGCRAPPAAEGFDNVDEGNAAE